MEKWTEFHTAFQVAKLRTVSAAARKLGVHRATVNRHIDALEKELGTPIFIRSPKGYSMTDFGEEVLSVVRKADELFEDLAGRARGSSSQIEGEIKISSVPLFSNTLMKPIAAFRAENPKCQVTIIASEDLQRLEYGEAHIALRVGSKPDHPDYVVQPFRQVGLNLFAHDDYISRMGIPNGAADLKNHELVMPSENGRKLPILSWISEQVRNPRIAIAANDPIVGREAVMAGLGIGVMSEFDAAGRSGLRAVLPPNEAWTVPLWLVTHVDLHRTEKVQAMTKYIKAFRE